MRDWRTMREVITRTKVGVKSNSLRPCHSLTDMWQFCFDASPDSGMELAVVIEDTQRILPHLIARKEFRDCASEVESQLDAFAVDLGTQFVVGQQQPAFGTRGGTAGIEEPGG